MKPTLNSLLLSVAASIFLIIVGCGGGGGGGGGTAPVLPTSADVSLTKTVNNTAPEVDDNVVFTITVSNAGPSVATGVVVSDLLPSGFTYFTDNSGGTYNPASGAWTVGSVAVGASQELNIEATVNDTGNYTNIAEVTAANQSDPNTGNNVDGVAAAPPGITVAINQIQTVCNTAGATSDKAFVTVVDQLGNPVTNLGDLVFALTETQNAQSFPVDFNVAFTNEIISISIVLDYSESMFDINAILPMETAVVNFTGQLAADDEAEIIKFNETIEVVQPFTTDKRALEIAIAETDFPSRAVTELYPAIIKGIDDVALRDPMNRKAVVVITDGRNFSFSPNITIDTVIADAEAKDIPVFTIGLGNDLDVVDLEKLSNQSGGLFYRSFTEENLEDIYNQIADALIKNQFVFTYDSSLTGGVPAPATLTVEADFNGLINSATKGFTSCP